MKQQGEIKNGKDTFDYTRVVVRFREGLKFSDKEDYGNQIDKMGIAPWKKQERYLWP